jgi:glycosyltransferase involved in cell wall biosynthesis
MRIVVADYSGHPFQVQLSRELARRGHAVLHLHFAEFQTPKGRLMVEDTDPATLGIESVSLGRPFAKHNFFKRRFQEVQVGKGFAARILAFRPDAVISSNLPLDTIHEVEKACRRNFIKFIFWQQDIYSVAIDRILSARYGFVGKQVGRHYKVKEMRVLQASDAVVAISEDFVGVLRDIFQLSGSKVHVIENWAPLADITPRTKDNGWSRAHQLEDKEVVLYTGTLGMKHDPRILVSVAESLQSRPAARMVVVSEGPAADWLRSVKQERGLAKLEVLPFQPFSVYSDVLGTASILLSILDADSGVFSVPSKVLSYLCAERAIVLSGPRQNLAARTLDAAGAGVTVSPGDTQQLIAAVSALFDDADACRGAGIRGRAYAEKAFDIGVKADQFEKVLSACSSKP